LARAQIRSIDQRLPCRRAGRSRASGLRETDGARFRRELVIFGSDKFCVTSLAFQGEEREDGIANFVFGYFVPDFFHDTGRVHSRNEGKIADQFRQVTFADRHVDRVERRCDDADKDFIVGWLGSRHVFKLQHLWSTIRVDDNGAHLPALRPRQAS
jgi:hypothetical protein